MSTRKLKKKAGWGGFRPGAGRPKGSGTKTKISVSVNRQTWHAALKSWTGKASHLVEMAISAHVKRGTAHQEAEAQI